MIAILQTVKNLIEDFISTNNIDGHVYISPDVIEIEEADNSFHFYITIADSSFKKINTLYWTNNRTIRIGIAKRADTFLEFMEEYNFENEFVSFLFEQMECSEIKIDEYAFDEVNLIGMVLVEVSGGLQAT